MPDVFCGKDCIDPPLCGVEGCVKVARALGAVSGTAPAPEGELLQLTEEMLVSEEKPAPPAPPVLPPAAKPTAAPPPRPASVPSQPMHFPMGASAAAPPAPAHAPPPSPPAVMRIREVAPEKPAGGRVEVRSAIGGFGVFREGELLGVAVTEEALGSVVVRCLAAA